MKILIFYKKICNKIENEKDITNINFFTKTKLYRFIRSIQKELINYISFDNCNEDSISIKMQLTDNEYNNIFGYDFYAKKFIIF